MLAHSVWLMNLTTDLILEIAERVNRNPSIPQQYWDDLALGCGYPGHLLLFANLERKGIVKEGMAHQYVLKIKEVIETRGVVNFSLFGGLTGVCFALQQASDAGRRYQKMLETLHQFLLEKIEERYFLPIAQGGPYSSTLYDVIQGLSGIGAYILQVSERCSEKISKALIALCQPIIVDNREVPGWYLGPDDILNRNKSGNFNLGLAHGVTGILAYLSLATLKGVEVAGQSEMIQQISTWLLVKSHNMRWPATIPFEGEQSQTVCKDAWCYGVPGIARTLFLAGKALKDEDLKSFAAEAFRRVFTRSREEWQLPGPMLCHGIAGLLMITLEMSKERGCEDLKKRVEELYPILVSSLDIEQSQCEFLDGSAGVALTLLSLEDPDVNWHYPLMIHG